MRHIIEALERLAMSNSEIENDIVQGYANCILDNAWFQVYDQDPSIGDAVKVKPNKSLLVQVGHFLAPHMDTLVEDFFDFEDQEGDRGTPRVYGYQLCMQQLGQTDVEFKYTMNTDQKVDLQVEVNDDSFSLSGTFQGDFSY